MSYWLTIKLLEEEEKKQKKKLYKTKLHSKNEEFLLKVLRKSKINYIKEGKKIITEKPKSLWFQMEDGYYKLEFEEKDEDFFLKIIQEAIKDAIIDYFKKTNMVYEINERNEEVLIIGRRC